MAEERGYKIDMKTMKNQMTHKINALKDNSMFHIQALENALNDVKLSKNAIIEQLTMSLEDAQSEALRSQG